MSDQASNPNTIVSDRKRFLRFFIPSVLGLMLFLMPVTRNGELTVMLGLYVDWMILNYNDLLMRIVVWITVFSAILGGYCLIFKPKWKENRPLLYAMAETTPIWFLLRAAGASIGIMVLFEIGPEILRLEDTGFVMFNDIGIGFFLIVIPGCFLMPLLTEYGAMDFIGVMAAPLFKRAFNLPGRSAVDAISSFVSSSLVGIMLTSQQYQRNRYTGREAVAIVTNFSVVSVPFALVIATVSGIGDVFFLWYFASMIACVACAIITVRIPPISRIPDIYKDGTVSNNNEDTNQHQNIILRGVDIAMKTADNAPPVKRSAKLATHMSMEQLFAVLGPSLALGTMTTILAFHSPVGELIGTPISWIISLFNVENAKYIAPGFVFGFLDQFIPAVIASNIEGDVMRFVLAGLSMCQIIFMSETGVIILRCGLPIKFSQLLQIFIIRTLIVIPILLIFALIIF
ncbi:YjiH family protein [Pseudemcibacter aquimaris]|uniref:YjiH family protein n=1 Tax=Pseudemcibacter aquimaris TaxID=2857064 RepID=UPI002013318C|nr:nucleoside recognition domain-containing protein [Pseudemcibacter aquimaris]MCC3861403.1 hypothetical protein [Pseudemcibacter aquimaris]WDU58173.1 hypothetical protein KW060_13345 [Pseudemcibacter aquimaris]